MLGSEHRGRIGESPSQARALLIQEKGKFWERNAQKGRVPLIPNNVRLRICQGGTGQSKKFNSNVGGGGVYIIVRPSKWFLLVSKLGLVQLIGISFLAKLPARRLSDLSLIKVCI